MTLLTQRQAAALLHLSERTLERYRVSGIGPKFCLLGRRAVRYRLTDIESYIAKDLKTRTEVALDRLAQVTRQSGEQTGTFFSHTHDDTGGRFKAVSSPVIVGSEPIGGRYPAGPAWCADPVPAEMPLGVDINEMPTTGEPHEIRASIASLGPSTHSAKAPPNRASDDAPPLTSRIGVEQRGARLGPSSRTFRRR